MSIFESHFSYWEQFLIDAASHGFDSLFLSFFVIVFVKFEENIFLNYQVFKIFGLLKVSGLNVRG